MSLQALRSQDNVKNNWRKPVVKTHFLYPSLIVTSQNEFGLVTRPVVKKTNPQIHQGQEALEFGKEYLFLMMEEVLALANTESPDE